MTQDREELKRLAEAALSEPWATVVSGPKLEADEIMVKVADGRDWPVVAEFILAAKPQTVLSLLSDLEAMQEENGRLRKALRWIASQKSTMHDEVEAWELQDYARQSLSKEPEA